jgi:hypothetical protein
MPTLELKFESTQNRYRYGESLRFVYRAKNLSRRAVFLAVNPVNKAKRGSSGLDVRIGELGLPDFPDYFQYRIPKLTKLAPGRMLQRKVRVGMPVMDSVVGNDGLVHQQEIELAGSIKVRLLLGYGISRFEPHTPDPRGEFLKWQKLFRSRTVTVKVEHP